MSTDLKKKHLKKLKREKQNQNKKNVNQSKGLTLKSYKLSKPLQICLVIIVPIAFILIAYFYGGR